MGPKKPLKPGGERREGLKQRLGELEDYLKDYILEEANDDPILNQYISLIRLEEKIGVSIFTGGLLNRPIFWERHIRPWILEGFQELQTISDLAKPPV